MVGVSQLVPGARGAMWPGRQRPCHTHGKGMTECSIPGVLSPLLKATSNPVPENSLSTHLHLLKLCFLPAFERSQEALPSRGHGGLGGGEGQGIPGLPSSTRAGLVFVAAARAGGQVSRCVTSQEDFVGCPQI